MWRTFYFCLGDRKGINKVDQEKELKVKEKKTEHGNNKRKEEKEQQTTFKHSKEAKDRKKPLVLLPYQV